MELFPFGKLNPFRSENRLQLSEVESVSFNTYIGRVLMI